MPTATSASHVGAATLGVAPGFLINAATFALVVLVLANLHNRELSPRTPMPRAAGQIRQGLAYVCADPLLAATSIVMIVVFATAYNFQISLALIASEVLTGDGQTYGTLMSSQALGAVVGSLIHARHARTGLPRILAGACALAATQTAVATVHSLLALLAAIFAYGISAGLFNVTVVSTLQLLTTEDMRGRRTAWYTLCFLGSSLAGGPAFGALAEWVGVSGALLGSAVICTAVTLVIAIWRTRRRPDFAV